CGNERSTKGKRSMRGVASAGRCPIWFRTETHALACAAREASGREIPTATSAHRFGDCPRMAGRLTERPGASRDGALTAQSELLLVTHQGAAPGPAEQRPSRAHRPLASLPPPQLLVLAPQRRHDILPPFAP